MPNVLSDDNRGLPRDECFLLDVSGTNVDQQTSSQFVESDNVLEKKIQFLMLETKSRPSSLVNKPFTRSALEDQTTSNLI